MRSRITRSSPVLLGSASLTWEPADPIANTTDRWVLRGAIPIIRQTSRRYRYRLGNRRTLGSFPPFNVRELYVQECRALLARATCPPPEPPNDQSELLTRSAVGDRVFLARILVIGMHAAAASHHPIRVRTTAWLAFRTLFLRCSRYILPVSTANSSNSVSSAYSSQ